MSIAVASWLLLVPLEIWFPFLASGVTVERNFASGVPACGHLRYSGSGALPLGSAEPQAESLAMLGGGGVLFRGQASFLLTSHQTGPYSIGNREDLAPGPWRRTLVNCEQPQPTRAPGSCG